MTNRIKLSEVVPQLAYSNEQVEEIEQLLNTGNENYTGAEIWQSLNQAGYVIIPTVVMLQAIKAVKTLGKLDVGPDTNH